jgi:CheY-like chemotaxis protein
MEMSILVVDDERGIADTLREVFRLAGYSSIAVYNAEDALAVLKSTPPALMVTDVIMPGMNGVELAIRARALCPEAKILLISGNAVTQDLVERAHQAGHSFELLAKPIPPRQMLAKVAAILGQG